MSARAEIERLLGEYLAGSGPRDAAAFCRAHPEHTEALRRHLALLEVVDDAFDEAEAPARLGPYRIERELGTGGMGTVYRAVAERAGPAGPVGTVVALKLLHPHLFRTGGFFKRFLREADLGRRIEHPNVVRTLDVDALEQDGRTRHFLVMEYVEGQTLREVLDELERVPEELARHVGLAVCHALEAVHAAGAVHRDVKPENVLVTPDQQVKVMDLGVARLVDEQVRLSQTGAFVGSLQYASPEQFGRGEVDARTDLHGLGLLLYELCAGENPFFHEEAHACMGRILHDVPRRLGERNPQVSPFLEEVVHQLLEKDPAARFASADELALVLARGEASAWWQERARRMREATRGALRRIRVPRETAVHGREEQLARLQTQYGRARDGDGRVVLLEGEAGIGKTRLVDEVVARLERSGETVHVLYGSYPPGGAATACSAISAACREHLAGDDLEMRLRDYLAETPALVPAFAALLRGDAAPAETDALTQDSLQTCFTHLLRGLAAQRPTLLVVDDLHFAPPEGRALFSALAHAVPGHRILLVGTSRPGLPEAWTASLGRLEQSSSVTVDRLGPKDLVGLLADLFRSERLAEELAGRIAVKSDGNPFFVLEIVQGLREGQFLKQRPDGSWDTTQILEEIAVPSSVLDLVMARVADVGDDQRALLDVAACWGYEFDPTLVAEALGLGRLGVLRALGRVEREHRLVRSVGRNYVFDHHQVQEALYGALNEQLREAYHSLLADALAAREDAAHRAPEDLDPSTCIALCEHRVRGEEPRLAARYVRPALGHLGRSLLFHEALALADRALARPGLLEGADRVEVLLSKAEWLRSIGRGPDRGPVLDEAELLVEELGRPDLGARLCFLRSVQAASSGDLETAGRRAAESLALARETGDPQAEVSGHLAVAIVHYTGIRLEEARRAFEAGIALADRRGVQRGVRRLRHLLAITCDRMGLRSEALAHLEAVERMPSLSAVEERLDGIGTHLIRGQMLRADGEVDRAQTCFERTLETARELGLRIHQCGAQGELSTTLRWKGQLAAALDWAERRLTIAEEVGQRHQAIGARGQLGCLYRDLGRLEASCADLRSAVTLAREIADPLQEGGWRADLARTLEMLRDLDGAARELDTAVASQREIRVPGHVAQFLVPLARVAWARGEHERARSAIEEALSIASELDIRDVIALATAQRALWGEGSAEAALAVVREQADRAPVRKRLRTHHLAWRLGGDIQDLDAAHDLLSLLVEHAPEEDRVAMVERVPLHRDVAAAWAAHGRA